MAVSEKSMRNLKPTKKGEVRNPKGKPKGSVSSKTVIRAFLELQAFGIDPKSKRKIPLKGLDGGPITYFEGMVLKMIEKAMKGDISAMNLLLDRLEGRAKQTTDVTIPQGAVVYIGGKKLDGK